MTGPLPSVSVTRTFNRLHPIPFTITIPKSEIDRNLTA